MRCYFGPLDTAHTQVVDADLTDLLSAAGCSSKQNHEASMASVSAARGSYSLRVSVVREQATDCANMALGLALIKVF
jgi:hypothetical protein